MGEVLIKVDHVSKKFAKDLKKSLLYGLSDVFSGITKKQQDKSLRKDEFWAVKDISFEVRRGECLGLIGHNGAGKSTLLKILNGLIAPDEGSVTMYGKVGALIELGAGFNPILTGRENIYNNAAIIGFSKQEIEAKFDEIVAFAEIEEFINMPVQNYSSGMKVRLGFAIAAQMQPDVLIIDEVLAVGDLGFILKCFKQIDKLLPHTAVVFVSHSMPMVARVSNQIMLMEKGTAVFQGKEVSKGINLTLMNRI
jgi:lipopolysaccharide transport system ATP-binding protein